MNLAKRILRPEIQFPAFVGMGMLLVYAHGDILVGFALILWCLEAYVAGHSLGELE